MRLAFVAARDPRESVTYFSGIPHFLFQALARQTDVVAVTVAADSPALATRLISRISRRLAGRQGPWGLRSRVLTGLARRTARAVTETQANVALTIGQGYLVHWNSPIPAASFSDVLYGSVADFPDRFGKHVALTAGQRRRLAAIGQMAVDRAVRLFVTSDYALKGAQANLGTQILPGKAVVTHVGANFTSLPQEVAVRPAPPPLRLLWVGTSWENKGGPEALETLATLRRSGVEATLDLVGRTPQDVQDSSVRVHGFLRKDVPVERQRLFALFHDAHLLLHPTRADFTPCGLAEAAAMSVPAVATPVGGIPGMFRDDEIALVELEEYPARAAGVIARLLEGNQLAEMSRKVRRRFESDLNWDIIAKRIVSELAGALRERRP